jgi:hypothetical protein
MNVVGNVSLCRGGRSWFSRFTPRRHKPHYATPRNTMFGVVRGVPNDHLFRRLTNKYHVYVLRAQVQGRRLRYHIVPSDVVGNQRHQLFASHNELLGSRDVPYMLWKREANGRVRECHSLAEYARHGDDSGRMRATQRTL